MLSFSKFISEDKGPAQDKYHAGVSDSTKSKRIAHFKDRKGGDAPGDKKARKKGIPQSKHTKKYKALYGSDLKESGSFGSFSEYLIENKGLRKKAEESGISYGILKQVYDRGVAAWKSGHRPGTNPSQWGMARANSFITGGKTRTTADKDLWKKHSASKKKKKAKTEEVLTEATYKGRKVKLNDPTRLPSGSKKKFKVYTTNPKNGNVVKVTFGDPNLSIKRDSDKRRKAFRARHGCDVVTYEDDRHTPKYWSCKMWQKGKTVSELD